MPVKIIPPTPSAYTYPLLIKHLLHAAMVRSPDQEIVYRDIRQRTHRELRRARPHLEDRYYRPYRLRRRSLPLTSVGKVDKKKLRANYV
jgi:non-ribosomal peptide synthetase component E (peptide arylation enzyme)